MKPKVNVCTNLANNYEIWKRNANLTYTNPWIDILENDTYYTLEHKEGQVMILPIVQNSYIVLVKAKRKILGDSVWELPAGGAEQNESFQVTAQRELAEETGIKVSKLSRFKPYPSLILASNRMPMFPSVFHIDLTMDEFKAKFDSDDEIETVNIFEFDAIKELICKGLLCTTLPIAVISRFLFMQELNSHHQPC